MLPGAALITEGGRLEREGRFADAWAALAEGGVHRARYKKRLPQAPGWDGVPRPGLRLSVLRLIRHVGAELRMARLLPTLMAQGIEVTLVCDPRLVPLVARSYPGLHVTSDQAAALDWADAWASHEQVAQVLWSSPSEIAAHQTPLRAEAERVHALRGTYGGGQRRLIGLSWWSSNARKDLPSPEALAQGIQRVRACRSDPAPLAVSLQYDAVQAGVARLRAAMPVLSDTGLDPMQDLDGFAAQVAAMDAVVSVSNTTVHMAGALGVPCVMLMDDGDHLIWPPEGEASVFYPSVTILRRRARPWAEVCAEGWRRACAATR